MAINVQAPPEPGIKAPARDVIEIDLQNPTEPSKTTLVGGIIADVQQLIQQQLAMFRQEFRDDLRKSKDAALSLALAIGIALAGSVLVLIMLPLLLHWAAPELPLWASFGIVGGGLTVLGGVLIYSSVKRIKSINPLSDTSIAAFKENLKWTTSPK
jgi:hypothetical protein